jgi:hypothetical protein
MGRDSEVGKFGAIAQLGERFNGIEEVVGSIPSGSTIPAFSDALSHRPHEIARMRLNGSPLFRGIRR